MFLCINVLYACMLEVSSACMCVCVTCALVSPLRGEGRDSVGFRGENSRRTGSREIFTILMEAPGLPDVASFS